MSAEHGEQLRICPIREHNVYEAIMREMIKNGELQNSSVVALQMAARSRAAQSHESVCTTECKGVIKKPRTIGPIKLPTFLDVKFCPNPPLPVK